MNTYSSLFRIILETNNFPWTSLEAVKSLVKQQMKRCTTQTSSDIRPAFIWSDVQSWTKGQPHNTNAAAELFGWNRRNWRYWSVWLLRGSNILLCWCNFVGVTETKCRCKWFLKAVCHLNHMEYFWTRTFAPFENNLIMLLYIQNDSKRYVFTLDAEKRVMRRESGNTQDRISQSVIIHFW